MMGGAGGAGGGLAASAAIDPARYMRRCAKVGADAKAKPPAAGGDAAAAEAEAEAEEEEEDYVEMYWLDAHEQNGKPPPIASTFIGGRSIH